MKHFVQARQAALKALADPEIASLAKKACLIIDLQGRMKVLAELAPGSQADELRKRVEETISAAADIFWGKQVWIQDGKDNGSSEALYSTAWSEAHAEPPNQEKTFVLDRHLSKDAWLGSPVQPPWPLNEHTPPIIYFYSFKGGVGRTTALLALATYLARNGKKAIVIDFDLEAPGAGVTLSPAPDVPPGLGLLDFLLDSQVTTADSMDISAFYHLCDDRTIIKDGEPIYVLPSGELDRWYLERLARVNYEYLYQTAWKDVEHSPLHMLLKLLRKKIAPDFILIDSRAGLHDLGGLSLSGLAHLQLLFGLDSRQSWDGLSLVVSHLGKDMVRSNEIQRDCAIVHSMVSPRAGAEEMRRFREKSFQVFSDNYYDSAEMSTGEWPLPDPESAESPHYPLTISWSEKVMNYPSLSVIADVLCEGEYLKISQSILDKVDRTL